VTAPPPAVAAAAVALAIGAGLLGLAGPVRPAAAHTELLQASPGPGQRAGGTIELIDLAFLEPVSDAVVELAFGGAPIEGETVVADGTIIRFQLADPLSEPGRYDVSYHLTSYDLDDTDGGYFFTFAPDAPQPLRLGTVAGEPPGRNWVQLAATVVLVACLAGLAFLFLSRLEAKRRRAAAAASADGQPDGG
jgi:methionine-rich copper-binding protein CopC